MQGTNDRSHSKQKACTVHEFGKSSPHPARCGFKTGHSFRLEFPVGFFGGNTTTESFTGNSARVTEMLASSVEVYVTSTGTTVEKWI